MKQSHIDPTTPLEPLPEEHWRQLMREQIERNAQDHPRTGVTSRLTQDDIAEIVWRYQNEPNTPMRVIASDYGISARYALNIGRRDYLPKWLAEGAG